MRLSKPLSALFLLGVLLGAVFASAARAAPDLIFADGFENEAAGPPPPPPVCDPPPAGYFQGGPLTLVAVWAPQPIGSSLAQVKLAGDSYESYRFTRADLPADLTEFQGDTSNVGNGAVGADLRMVAVEECEGDFVPAQGACAVNANEGAFLYLNFGAPLPFACNLDASKTYYWNVTFGASPCNSGLNRNTCAFRVAVLPR